MSVGPTYQLGMFTKHVGQKFQLRDESALRTLELIEAVGSSGQLEDDSRNFTLLFRDPESSVESHLAQATYRLDHDALGELQLFWCPWAREARHKELTTRRFSLLRTRFPNRGPGPLYGPIVVNHPTPLILKIRSVI